MFSTVLRNKDRSWQLFASIALFGLVVGGASAECNVCQANKVACVNSTSFYLCFDGDEPVTDVMYHCKNGFDCTDLNAICVQSSSSRAPSCGDTSRCGLCSAHANYLFACHSRTTFQWCYGAARPIGQMGRCPQGMVCDASSDFVCVPDDGLKEVTCDIIDVPPQETTTAMPDTTARPEDEPLTATEVCAQRHEVGLFPTIPADPECRRYVYCFYRNGIIQGTEYACDQNTYFEAEMERCTLRKPSSCP